MTQDAVTDTVKAQRGIQSVEVAGRLLRALADARIPLALGPLAEQAGLASAQAHTYLVSLVRLGLIKRSHIDGRYEPGPLALRLGMARLDQDPAYRIAVPHAQALSAAIGFSVALSLPTPQGPTIVHYAHAGKPLHVNLHVGTVMALAATATGRAYCAFLPQAQWQAVWDVQRPPEEFAGPGQFDAALEAIRARGMERAINTPSPAVSSLAMPLLDGDGRLLLVLTAIGPTGAIDVGWRGPVAQALRHSVVAMTQAMEGANG